MSLNITGAADKNLTEKKFEKKNNLFHFSKMTGITVLQANLAVKCRL